MSNATEEKNHAKDQARAQINHIVELVKALNHGRDQQDDTLIDEAQERIDEKALSVQVRSGWFSPGAELKEREAVEYEILLCTGGPAVRITGSLNGCGADDSRVQYQDWFTPWTDYRETTDEEDDMISEYVNAHYFGE